MTRAIFLSLPLLLLSQSVWATDTAMTAMGHSALALAGVVAPYSPTLSMKDKRIMAKLFDGQAPAFPAGGTITITADSITCFAGDVAINVFNCDLMFGKSTITVTGRKGNEIYATLIEAGVPSSGAAGKIYEALVQLSCTIDPNQVEGGSGAGASCSFTTNQ